MNKKFFTMALTLFPCILSASSPALEYGVVTKQNARQYQEDRYIVKQYKLGTFFGLYDGHGGSDVSQYLCDNLTSHFSSMRGSIKTKMFEAFKKSETYCLENFPVGGSTALVAFLGKDNILHYAWAGDSRLVCENGCATHDHKPIEEGEKKRIELNGGKLAFYGVPRIHGLAVSRSIGDRDVKNAGIGQVIAVPEYDSVELTKNNRFFVMASDGLWDTLSNEKVIDEVQSKYEKNSAEYIAEYLADLAIEKGSKDNITVIVAKLLADS
jgi:protein phosphatase 2C